MGDYEDYAFVTKGDKRQQIVISLFAPRRPKELVRELKLHSALQARPW
jgi:hypothetical protein